MPGRMPRMLFLWALLPAIFHGPTAMATARPVEYRPGEILVQLRPHVSTTALSGSLRQGMQVRQTLNHGRLVQLSLPDNVSVPDAAAALSRNPDVLFAEPNYLVRAQSTPNDPFFTLQWGLDNTGQVVNGYVGTPGTDIDALQAWDLDKHEGDGPVVVAVVDTGCALDHPDLAQRLWVNTGEIPDNGIDDDGNGYVDDIHGWDIVDVDNAPWDTSGHGTHVAGIIAAQDNNGLGISGVDHRARIMAVRFMDGFEKGSVTDAIAAIEYALAQGARIINCSWGGSGNSTALKNTMAGADALFICAAGNDGSDTDMVGFYPADFGLDNIVSVAAVDQMDRLAGFSNFGETTVNVAAPGVRIFSLDADRQEIWQTRFDSGLSTDWTPGGGPDRWDIRPLPLNGNTSALSFAESGAYAMGDDTWIQTPAMDLSDHHACMAELSIIGSTQADKDRLFLEISVDGDQWNNLPLKLDEQVFDHGISGALTSWTRIDADLGHWDGLTRIYLRLRFTSDADGTDTGYDISRLALTATSEGDTYVYRNGTSMAAAFVSGLAALIVEGNGGLTPFEIKEIIENSVDLDPDINDLMSSGGRVNAYNALTLLRGVALKADSQDSGDIRLSWSDLALPADKVTIERRTDTHAAFIARDTVTAAQGTFLDTGLDPQINYCYRLSAVVDDGIAGYSNQAMVDTVSPSQPQGGDDTKRGGCFLNTLLPSDRMR